MPYLLLAVLAMLQPSELRGAEPAVPAGEKEALAGISYDYDYDGKDVGHPNRAWHGRAYVPDRALGDEPVPLVIFLHGLNAALIKYRWIGGGTEGDVRLMIDRLIAEDRIRPVVIAAPSSIIRSEVEKGASWRQFDLQNFIDLTKKRLQGVVQIDPDRIIVAGHSGAGCSPYGGLAKLNSARPLLGILSIDTCMQTFLAERLARSQPTTNVVVSYQTRSWKRPVDLFQEIFRREVKAHPAAEGVLRELDHLQGKKVTHDATVALTFDRWLPELLPPPTK